MKHVSLGIIIHRVTAKRLCFQSFELTDRFIRHSSSGGEVSLSIFSTNHETFFRFARRIVTFFPSTSFGNWEEKSKREKERETGGTHGWTHLYVNVQYHIRDRCYTRMKTINGTETRLNVNLICGASAIYIITWLRNYTRDTIKSCWIGLKSKHKHPFTNFTYTNKWINKINVDKRYENT